MKKYLLVAFLLTALLLSACSSGTTGVTKIASDFNVTEEQATDLNGKLNEVGIGEYKSVTHDELLDNAHSEGEKGYRLETSDANNIIVYINSDGTTNMIRYADNDLYADGAVKAKISDFILTDMEKATLQTQSEKAITSLLKAPSTAEFPSALDWQMGKIDGVTIIQSYVDSQNGFGAMLRSEFQIKIKDEQVISLILDGTEYIQK